MVHTRLLRQGSQARTEGMTTRAESCQRSPKPASVHPPRCRSHELRLHDPSTVRRLSANTDASSRSFGPETSRRYRPPTGESSNASDNMGEGGGASQGGLTSTLTGGGQALTEQGLNGVSLAHENARCATDTVMCHVHSAVMCW